MLKNLNPEIKALILDMDGVLWIGDQPVGNLKAIFDKIAKMRLRVAIITNNSTKSVLHHIDRFRSNGVHIHENQIITSAIAASSWLADKYPNGGAVYIVGEDGLADALLEKGFYNSEEDVLAVIVGMDRELTYKKMAKANAFIREGAVFVGTNPDSSFPTTGGLAPGAGSIIAAIAVASGVEPTIMGKPHTTMFKMAIEKLNVKPEEAVSIGDRLDTDILGGKRAGLRTALVMTGATREKDLINNTIYPDLVSPDLTTLVGL